MRLKIYQAESIGAAMAMVRDELGADALILANRVVDGGIELTAAQEDAASAEVLLKPRQHGEIASPLPRLPNAPTEIARAGTLRWHGVPVEMATRLGRGDLLEIIGSELRFGTLPCLRDDPPLLLVGPPGSGKTLTVARLATRLKLSGQNSMVITADGRRAGATEQLAAFTRLLGLTLIVADTPKQVARAVARRAHGDPVLIDMPGLDPFDLTDQAYLNECRTVIGAAMALVLPAGLDPADAEELAGFYGQLGSRYLVATRLDQSRRLGGVLAAASTGLVLTDAGISPAVADGLIPMTPRFLADRLSRVRQPDAEQAVRAAANFDLANSPLANAFPAFARANGEHTRSST